jgi:hypothetical protein
MIERHLEMANDFNGLANLCDNNFIVVANHINAHEERISDIGSAINKLTRQSKFKASKLSLLLVIAAGITYVIHNEYEKTTMKEQLIELDKKQRGLDTFQYPTEDEGEALDPI